jgi:ABC-type multidrug transport system fused ATPase/permease subunit
MRISSVNTGRYSIGEVVNMISTDANRFAMVTPFFTYLIVLPVQMALGLGSIGYYLGVALVPGLVTLFLCLGLTGLLGRSVKNISERMMKIKDGRLKCAGEIFNGVRFIKFNGWEIKFLERLYLKRKDELELLKSLFRRVCFINFWNNFSPVLFLVVVLGFYAVIEGEMQLGNVFAAINAYMILMESFRAIPFISSFSLVFFLTPFGVKMSSYVSFSNFGFG